MELPADIQAAMPYHLASDIAHDHGLGVVITEVIKKIVAEPVSPGVSTDEDVVVDYFNNLLKEGENRSNREHYARALEGRQVFELPSSTETLPHKFDWTLPFEFAFVHDAGPKLFKLTGKDNYITYGSILDSATKPTTGAKFAPIPKEVGLDLFKVLGFAPNVGPLELTEDTPTSTKAVLTYNKRKYDMAGGREVVGSPPVVQPKKINEIMGFLASKAVVKAKLGPPKDKYIDQYIIGKALGDALQVVSVLQAKADVPVPLIHNTEDRLNYVRCRVFDIPVVHVGRPKGDSPVRICEFVPSSELMRDTPETRFTRYLTKLKGFIQLTAGNYDRAIAQFLGSQDSITSKKLSESYRKEAVRQIQLLKIGTLFHFTTWFQYYYAKKAAPTSEDVTSISQSHDILSASVKRLSPFGSIMRVNKHDYVQKFIVCHAPPDDCDLGGFPIVASVETELPTADTIVKVLLGKLPLTEIKGGAKPLKIDVGKLQALMTELGIQTQPLVPPPSETLIPSGGGAGYGIRGTYYFELIQDAKNEKDAPSRTLVGGAAVKRKRDELEPEEAPEAKRARPAEDKIGTDDASLFRWYITTKASDVTPEDVLGYVKRLKDSDSGNDEVYDFGLIETLEDEGVLPIISNPNRERCIQVWNAFMTFVNYGLLKRGKGNTWVSLHEGDQTDDPILDQLAAEEDALLNPVRTPETPPRPVPMAPMRRQTLRSRRSSILPRFPMPPLVDEELTDGGSRLLLSPFSGVSDSDWADAVRELEEHYSK